MASPASSLVRVAAVSGDPAPTAADALFEVSSPLSPPLRLHLSDTPQYKQQHTATATASLPPEKPSLHQKISPPEKPSPPPATMPPPVPALPEEAVEETRPAPALPEDILEQIFLRLPPDEPASLVRATLASKAWLALLTGPRFRGRYREHHGAPPMLGFLTSCPWDCLKPNEGDPVPPFVSTTKFRARIPDQGWGQSRYTAWDCRHGRVLLAENNELLEGPKKLAVWDPMTGRRRELQEPEVVRSYGLYAAAVLCAVSGCDHLACHEGPFRVVFLSLHDDGADDFVAQVCVSSLETCDCSKPCSDFHRAEWSDPCPGVFVHGSGFIEPRPPVLANNALHYMLNYEGDDAEILRYDLSSNCLSLIGLPEPGANVVPVSMLMTLEDGSLGFAHLTKRFTLSIWSGHIISDGDVAWTRRRVIAFRNLLPIQIPRKEIRLVGSVEGSDIIFVTTDLGIYKIDLKSLRQKKIANGDYLFFLIPYMSFHNPPEKGETL